MLLKSIRIKNIFLAAIGLLIISFMFIRFPMIACSEQGEKPVYVGYPLGFKDIGHFDGLTSGKIIINDVSYPLASGAVFNQPDYFNSGPSGFSIGDVVGLLINTKGEVESVWLLKRSNKKK